MYGPTMSALANVVKVMSEDLACCPHKKSHHIHLIKLSNNDDNGKDGHAQHGEGCRSSGDVSNSRSVRQSDGRVQPRQRILGDDKVKERQAQHGSGRSGSRKLSYRSSG
jgi:hypothetical protein